MDINLGLFSERLRRLLAGEEATLPDAFKQHFQNLHAEIEIVTSWLRDHEYDMAWLLLQKILRHQTNPDLEDIMEDINCFAYESEKAIDTIISNITLHKSQRGSKVICDFLLVLQSNIIGIKQQLQQVQHTPTHIIDNLKVLQAEAGNSRASSLSFKKREIEGLDDRVEELLDILIEGPSQLSIVAILDGVEVAKTAFAAEAYNSNYVKHYFDCHAWVSVSFMWDFEKMLDDIIKSMVPLCRLSEIMNKNYEMKKISLRNYLMNKQYLVVLDDVWTKRVLDDILEILPDNQNGSRVLIAISPTDVLTSFQLENGDNIRLDLVPPGGALKATYQRWPLLILCHGSISLEEKEAESYNQPLGLHVLKYLLLPFYLKPCCLYLSVFPAHFEISTRHLYQLWIAEGFIPDNNEATAEHYLEQLISRGLVEAKKRRAGGSIKTYSFPSFYWIAVESIAYWVQFINAYSLKKGKSWKNIKRFTAFKNAYELNVLNDFDSFLHSLLYHSSQIDQLDPIEFENICKKFKFLRVIDLGSLVLNQYPSQIESFFFLRYLKLNIPSLKSLPSSLLCNLLNLYTLDMPSSYIDHTADDIWRMNKLRYLNFGSITLPAHPGKYCSSLENLIFISALHPSCCTPDILGRLPNLRNLLVRGDLSYYQSLLSKSLCRLNSLESLKLVNESKMPNLSKIVLSEYQFPQSLTHLSLSNTELMDDPMPTLEKLPHLQVLKLKQNSYSGRKLACGSRGFPNLKVLHLKSMLWLEDWTMGFGAMPKLECLIINPCAYLKRFPEHLWCKRSFNKLELWWPQPELRQMLRNFEDNERYNIHIYPYGM